MTNTDNTAAAITSVEVQPMLLDVAPAPQPWRVTNIVTKADKIVGQRFTFSEASLAEFKAGLTAKKVRGDARRLAMQEFFHADDVARRRILGRLWLENSYEKGMAPDTAEMRAKSGMLRLVSTIVPEKPAKKGKSAEAAKDAEIARLRAELAAMKAAARPAVEVEVEVEAEAEVAPAPVAPAPAPSESAGVDLGAAMHHWAVEKARKAGLR